ncbi:MAG: hypothetical protein V2A34_08125 [Lentisphaerota bacterium]
MRIHNQHLKIRFLVLCALFFLVISGTGWAQTDQVTLNAMLIRASNDGAPLDQRLEAIEFKLRRVFQFEYYRFVGESSSTISLPGDVTLSLGQGIRLEVKSFHADGDRIRSQVRWLRNDDVLLSTTVVMTRKVPVILGGVPDGSGTLIVTLTVR